MISGVAPVEHRVHRVLLWSGIGLAAGLLSVKYLLPYFTPFLVALFLVATLDPLVDATERALGLSRPVAVLLVLLVALSLVALALALLIANLVVELERLVTGLPGYSQELQARLSEWITAAELWVAAWPHPLDDVVTAGVDQATAALANGARNLLTMVGAVPNLLFVLVVAGVTTYFISRDKRVLSQSIFGLLPGGWRLRAHRVKREVLAGIAGFLRAQVLMVAMSSLLAIGGFALLGIPYAWLLGLLAGLLDLMPMIGPSGVLAPLVAYQVIAGNPAIAGALGVLWAVILLARQIMEPRILAPSLGLHPVTTLASLYLGAQVLGLSGFIIGPLVCVVLKAVFVVAVLPALPRG